MQTVFIIAPNVTSFSRNSLTLKDIWQFIRKEKTGVHIATQSLSKLMPLSTTYEHIPSKGPTNAPVAWKVLSIKRTMIITASDTKSLRKSVHTPALAATGRSAH